MPNPCVRCRSDGDVCESENTISEPVRIEVWTDSNNAYSAVHSSTQIDDRRLRIDIASIKENMALEGIVVNWCKGNKMLADCLTKQGASCEKLMNVITIGTLDIGVVYGLILE